MYPAQALRDELYTVSDLPDSLIIASGDFQQEMTKTGGFSPAYQGTNSEIFLTEEGTAFWDIFYNPGDGGDTLQFGQSCLVDGVYVKDQFADSYTLAYIITDENIGSTTITRQSLCVWTGNAGGVPVRLEYEDTDFFRWFMITPETEIQKGEPAFQNTPTGFYETGNIEFTVS